ncbi:MAG TPA: permease, partial [Terriglobales bacterium]
MSTQASVIKGGISAATTRSFRAQIIFQFVILGLLVLLLMNYKGTGGIKKIRQTQASGTLKLPALQATNPAGASSFRDAAGYLRIVWPALIFGVLISAAVRTSISRTPLHGIFGRGTVRDQVTGALTGMPLMLCSCCVAPIFPSIYQKTRRIGPALAVALAAPSLNPVALTLSFLLFPWQVAGGRLVMALTLVLIGSGLVAIITGSAKLPIEAGEATPVMRWRELFLSYAKSLAYVTLRTVPLVIVGIWVSMWIMRRLPLSTLGAAASAYLLGIAIIALIAVLLTLPSLFEIP